MSKTRKHHYILTTTTKKTRIQKEVYNTSNSAIYADGRLHEMFSLSEFIYGWHLDSLVGRKRKSEVGLAIMVYFGVPLFMIPANIHRNAAPEAKKKDDFTRVIDVVRIIFRLAFFGFLISSSSSYKS